MAPTRLTFRLSTAAFVAAAFLAGLGGGLLAAHAGLEADLPLADLADPDAARARHGDAPVVHGQVVERTVEAATPPGATTFSYLVGLDDGTARARFPVPRQAYDTLAEGSWILLPLRWQDGAYVAGAPEAALQPWMWSAAFVAAGAAAVGGIASRVAERGVKLRRDGDVVEIRAER